MYMHALVDAALMAAKYICSRQIVMIYVYAWIAPKAREDCDDSIRSFGVIDPTQVGWRG
jgi:hypothetical protein